MLALTAVLANALKLANSISTCPNYSLNTHLGTKRIDIVILAAGEPSAVVTSTCGAGDNTVPISAVKKLW